MTSTVPTPHDVGAVRPQGLFVPAVLILSNLVPLAGLLWWGWDAFVLLCLYWLETAVIGFWTILRIVTMSRDPGSTTRRSIAGTLALGGFFTVHAGLFMTVHMLFIFTLFAGPWAAKIHDARDFIRLIVIGMGLWIPLVAMFAGQGAIYVNDAVNHFVFGKAVPGGTSTGDVVGGLYKRIVIMHVAILGGGFIAQSIGRTAPLIVLVLIKTALEIHFQMKARRESSLFPPTGRD